MNSTVTATLSGQIVMEGFLDIRLPPWARRLIDRALSPSIPGRRCDNLVWRGRDGEAADPKPGRAEPALPFAIVPLVMFTARPPRKMAELVAPRWVDGACRAHRRVTHRAQREAVDGLV
jgi:manganese transport protein